MRCCLDREEVRKDVPLAGQPLLRMRRPVNKTTKRIRFRDITDEENGSHAYHNWVAHRGRILRDLRQGFSNIRTASSGFLSLKQILATPFGSACKWLLDNDCTH